MLFFRLLCIKYMFPSSKEEVSKRFGLKSVVCFALKVFGNIVTKVLDHEVGGSPVYDTSFHNRNNTFFIFFSSPPFPHPKILWEDALTISLSAQPRLHLDHFFSGLAGINCRLHCGRMTSLATYCGHCRTFTPWATGANPR